MAESRERDGLFGKYTEHFDDDGRKIGESRVRDGLFGPYVEHTDANGRKIGESRDREGFFGRYIEHTDVKGEKTGESRQRDGWFGKYTEHLDRDGNKIGESRQREGIFGRYTEHTGGGVFGGGVGSGSGAGDSEGSMIPPGFGAAGGTGRGGGGSRGGGGAFAGVVVIILLIGALAGGFDTPQREQEVTPPRPEQVAPVTEAVTGDEPPESAKRQAVADLIARNQNAGLVDAILADGAMPLPGRVIDITEPEGSGGFWTFAFESAANGASFNFLCSSYDELYVRLGDSDVDGSAVAEVLKAGSGNVVLHLRTADGQGPRSCPSGGTCDATNRCPLGIVIDPATNDSVSAAADEDPDAATRESPALEHNGPQAAQRMTPVVH